MDASQREPQRLSALYQYHNAPEVAPAHGLEYDDTVYPSSDKYPVIREAPSTYTYDTSNYKGKHAFVNDNRPPRIIFGMKVRTFLLVAAVMSLIVIGAAVGGAVGGKNMRDGEAVDGSLPYSSNVTSTSSSTSSAVPSATSTYAAPVPTYTPLSDCPASNATSYTSSYAKGSSGTVPAGAGLNFTKYCDVAGPLSQTGASRIAEAFVYSFSDCIEVCAGINFWSAGSNCSVAVYQPDGTRPGNCWVGSVQKALTFSALSEDKGTDVALLEQASS